MMERLFTMRAQAQACLMLLAGGAALGALWQLTLPLRRRGRVLPVLADTLLALALLGLLMTSTVKLGAGLRLHALLGLSLGLSMELALWELLLRAKKACDARKKKKEKDREGRT